MRNGQLLLYTAQIHTAVVQILARLFQSLFSAPVLYFKSRQTFNAGYIHQTVTAQEPYPVTFGYEVLWSHIMDG